MTIQLLDIDDVKLDFDNPRIKHVLEHQGPDATEDSRQSALHLALQAGSGSDQSAAGQSTYDSLLASIKESGGITHPIIVNNVDGVFTVIEGNTRAFIYKNFKRKNFAGNWDKIPAIVYDNHSKDAIESVRLQSHLVGPRQWDPHSKGKYLHHLWKNDGMSIEKIIAICGGNSSDIRNYINAFEDMEDYYKPITDQFNIKLFSGFVELQRSSILTALNEYNYTKHIFAEWLRDGRFSKLSDIRKLPQILANDEAKNAFLNGNTNEAIPYLLKNNQGVGLQEASIEALSDTLNQKINDMPYNEIRDMRSNPNCTTRASLASLGINLEDFRRSEFNE